MSRSTQQKTNWLKLLRDERADPGRAIVRLAHLAAAHHRAAAAENAQTSANGLATPHTDRLVNVAAGDVSRHKEVPR